jgi:DNA-binding NarL/FixJ family response regulator
VTSRITCVVADDHPAVVDSIGRFLTRQGIEILGRAHSGDEAVEQIEDHQPQVAVLDLRMPGLTAIDVAQRVASSSPRTAVIVYTGFANGERLAEAIRAGIRGFIVKDAPLSELVRAIGMVADGLPYVDPTLAAPLVRGGLVQSRERLTDHERDAIRLLADGVSTDRIGLALGVSHQSATGHIRAAMRKLRAETRTEAVATALRRCLIP